MATLTPDQLEDLQIFLKDWLRHHGRTQADLRRALRAESIRMPVLLEELRRLHAEQGLAALAERLCSIEDRWQGESLVPGGTLPRGDDEDALSDPLVDQLDLLLEEIRQEPRR